jgi:radical SAM protein with 4Fe4S-binding SPASM domain
MECHSQTLVEMQAVMNASLRYPLRIMLPAMVNTLVGRKSPVKVGIQLTNKCNLDCRFCYFKDETQQNNRVLSTKEIFAVIDDLRKMNISVLALTGGEPLLREDHVDILRRCTRHGLLTGIATNGTLLTHELVSEHRKAGLSWYHLSIDGASEEAQRISRGPGVFGKVDAAIDLMRESGIDIIATTVVCRENQHSLREIAGYINGKGIKIWSPTIVLPCGKGKAYLKDNLFSKDEIRAIYGEIYELGRIFRRTLAVFPMDSQIYYPYVVLREKPSWIKRKMYGFMGGCSVVKGTTVHINYDGSVKPCSYFAGVVPDANVKTRSIIDIFRNDPFLKRLRDRSRLKGACHDCSYQFFCAGCRSRGAALFDDPFEEDVYCIYR